MPSLPGLMGDVYFGDVETPLPTWTADDAARDTDDDSPTEEDRANVAAMLGFDPSELEDDAGGDTSFDFATEVDDGHDPDADEKAVRIAEILYGLFGADALSHIQPGKELGTSERVWDALAHPRGPNGRFIPRGSPEAVASAKAAIGRVLKGDKSAHSAEEVAKHLHILTVKQLKELHKEHGVPIPGKLRDELVNAVKSRLPEEPSSVERAEADEQAAALKVIAALKQHGGESPEAVAAAKEHHEKWEALRAAEAKAYGGGQEAAPEVSLPAEATVEPAESVPMPSAAQVTEEPKVEEPKAEESAVVPSPTEPEPLASAPEFQPHVEKTEPETAPSPTMEEPPKPEEITHAEQQPVAGPVPQPVSGGSPSGSDVGNDGGTRDQPVRPRIVVARPEHTKAGNTALVPESVRSSLNEAQQQGAALAIDAMQKHGGFLLADGTGVGKTRQELAVAQHFLNDGKKVVIVSPAEVIKPDWKKGVMSGSFAADSAAMGVPVKLTKGDVKLSAGIVHVTTYNELGKLKSQIDGETAIIFDESHFMKNKTSSRYKHGKEAIDKAGAVMYATATPGDKPLHIAHLAKAGVFGQGGTGATYQKLGMKLVDQRTHNGSVKCWQIDPKVGYQEAARRLSGLFDQMTKEGLMVKRELSMDGVGFRTDHIALSPEQHQDIEKVYNNKISETNGNKAVALMAARLHQEPMKIPATVDMVKEELAAGRSPVVFLGRVNDISDDSDDDEEIQSSGTAPALKAALIAAGIPESDIGELHGGATKTADQKKKAMNDFQSGKTKIIIATIQSGGTGINLDDTAGNRPRTMLMMTPPFTANDMAQAVGRIHRLNTKSESKVRGVLSDSNIDQWNAGILRRKFATLGAIVSGESSKSQSALGIEGEPEDTKEPFEWGESLTHKWPEVRGNTYPVKDKLEAMGGRLKQEDGRWVWRVPEHKLEAAHKATGYGQAPKPQEPSPAAKMVSPARAESKPEAPPITPARKEAIHQALRQLAATDTDRARERNGVGFNQMDSHFGGQLAEQGSLTDRQAEAAAKMLHKYKGQLGEELHKKVTTVDHPAPTEKPETKPEPPKAETVKPSEAPPADAPKIVTKKVQTARGERHVYGFRPDNAFWDAWRSKKDSLKDKYGVGVGKDSRTGDWTVSVWGKDAGEVQANLEGLKRAGAYNGKELATEMSEGQWLELSTEADPLADALALWREVMPDAMKGMLEGVELATGWVTIGASAKKGEEDEKDKEKHGGVHVFIGDGGKIEKGPLHMVGKHISDLKKGDGKKDNNSGQSASTPVDKPAATSDNVPVETKPQPQEKKMDATATKQPWEMMPKEYEQAKAGDNWTSHVMNAMRDGKPVPQNVIDIHPGAITHQAIEKLKAEFGDDYADKLKEKAAKFARVHEVIRRDDDGTITVRRQQQSGGGFRDHSKGDYVQDGNAIKVVAKAGKPYVGRHDGGISGYFQVLTLRDLKPKEEAEAKAAKAASYAVSHGGEPRNQDYPDLKKKQMAEYSEFVRQALVETKPQPQEKKMDAVSLAADYPKQVSGVKDGHIHVKWSYTDSRKEKLKAIGGAWSQSDRSWEIPADKAEALRDVFKGFGIKTTAETEAYAAKVKAEYEAKPKIDVSNPSEEYKKAWEKNFRQAGGRVENMPGMGSGD